MTITLIIIVGVLGIFLLQGIRKIKPAPPHKGQATWLGKRVPNKVYDEGWGFFPFFPYLVGFIPVKVERISFDVISEKSRTPDNAESRIPVKLTIRPTSLIEYIDSGEKEGIEHQLTGKIQERVREWASGPEKGPADWRELNQSHLEAVSVLVKQIAGNSVTVIPGYAQSVPTWIWLRYFAKPRPTKFLKNEKVWARNGWKKVKDVLDSLTPDKVKALEIAVAGRRKDIEALRTGTGTIILKDLGVTLERLNIGDIDVLGEVGKQAEQEAKEQQEKNAETLELEHLSKRINALMEAPPKGPGLSREQALEMVQLASKKATKTIDSKLLSFSLDASMAKLITEILGRKP